MLNTTNFFVGQEVKNYKEMCRLSGEKEKAGSPRDRQIENWKRFLNWDIKGHKFIITEVYDPPKPKIDLRKEGGRSVYSPILKKLIMHTLFLCHEEREIKENVLACTTRQFRDKVFGWPNLLGENFTQREYHVLLGHQITNEDIAYFEPRFESKINEVIEDCLKSLIKNGLLDSYKKTYFIKEDKKQRLSSDDEMKKIDSLKKKIMADMLIKNERYISDNKRKELYEKMNAELKASENWETSYRINLIKINDETLQKIEEFELNSYEEESLKIDFLLKVCDFLDQNASNAAKEDQEKAEKYYKEMGLCTDAEYQEEKLRNSEKRNPFRIETRRILPFKTLPKDYFHKQEKISNIIRHNIQSYFILNLI